MSKRRSYQDDYDERSPKRRRRVSSEPTEIGDRLESLVTRVGEKSTSSLESNLKGLADVIEADLQNYKLKILGILSKCARKLPEKVSVYTTLVGLLNARNYSFGGEFVEQIVRMFKDDLKACQFDEAKILLRFISDLVNCHVVSAGSVLQLYQSLLKVLNEQPYVHLRNDWYVYAVLSALPWVGKELNDKKEQEFEALLSSIRLYINRRRKIHHNFLKVWSVDSPHPQEEYLDCLWTQISKLHDDKWEEKHISRPYLAFDAVLSEALQHYLPQIMPPPHDSDNVYPIPKVIFRLFDYTDIPEGAILPGAHSIERYLIEEQVEQIIHRNHEERKECAIQLVSYPRKQTIPLDYVIVEVIFAELFTLPMPPYLEICLGSLLIELCKLQPSSMPQVLAQATELIFERLDSMNISCIERFSNWFAYHLSNFQFRWSWEDWAPCLELDHEHPKPKFIRELLLKCLRLSYHQRIKDFMPAQFAPLLPPNPVAIYKYDGENSGSVPGSQVAQKLLKLMKSKFSAQEIVYPLKELDNPLQMDDDNEPAYNPLKIDVFVQSMLYIARKSLSHSFAAISKFYPIFQELASTTDAQICILKALYEVWKDNQQMMLGILDKLLKSQIVECSAVANWVFSPEMICEFTKGYTWDILHLAIRKISKYVLRLQKELDEAREKIDKLGEDSDSEDENDDTPTEKEVETMEEKLEIAQSDQKNVFLIVFQRFIMILSEHIVKCDTDGHDFNNFWYSWTMGRLHETFLLHGEQVQKYVTTLETLLFSHDTDGRILQIFKQFCSLRS